MDDYRLFGAHFGELYKTLIEVDRDEVGKAVSVLKKARSDGVMVWLIGNGGSAATAAHFANDLVKMGKVRAIALPSLVPIVTAYGNDHGWGNMFVDPLYSLWTPEDVLVAISCSGNSKNVVRAAEMFEKVIVLTGEKLKGNNLLQMGASATICAMHEDITIQEDVHSAVCHAIAKALRK